MPRRLADAERIREFLRALGREAREDARLYLTGGATAALLGWRATTVDVDIKVVPEADAILRAIPRLKESLQINVEFACPSDFIPEVPGWADRSPFVPERESSPSSTTTSTPRPSRRSSGATPETSRTSGR